MTVKGIEQLKDIVRSPDFREREKTYELRVRAWPSDAGWLESIRLALEDISPDNIFCINVAYAMEYTG